MLNTAYEWVKGFNVQPDWGSCGVTIWLNFKPERFREILRAGKEKFPTFNTFRQLLSFDAWAEDRQTYLTNLAAAAKVVKEENLHWIPCYFNGWISQPNYGCFSAESLCEGKNRIYQKYLEESLDVLKYAPVLVHDVANEPFNNAFVEFQTKRVTDFLVQMARAIHARDDRPVTVGSQFYLDNPELDKEIDVISLHPYNQWGKSLEEFDAYFREKIKPVEASGKPVIITECVWGAHDAEGRRIFLETELTTFKKYHFGFLCHGLAISPVADLHPLDPELNTKNDLYMAFLDENFEIRPYHDFFNKI